MDFLDVVIVALGWIPKEVLRIATYIRAFNQADYEVEILKRLLYTEEMKFVWSTLLAEDRKTGGFLHPVVGAVLTADQVAEQHRACGKVLNLAFCAARDRIRATKEPEVEAEKQRLLDDLAHDWRVANELAAFGLHDPDATAAAGAALRLAQAKEERVHQWITMMRCGSDPLIIKNDRGDRVVRGVAIMIAEELLTIYGKRMGGTAMTLANVALDEKEKATRRMLQR